METQTKLDKEREDRHDLVEAGVRVADFAYRNSSTGGVYCIRGGVLDQGIRGVCWIRGGLLDQVSFAG